MTWSHPFKGFIVSLIALHQTHSFQNESYTEKDKMIERILKKGNRQRCQERLVGKSVESQSLSAASYQTEIHHH